MNHLYIRYIASLITLSLCLEAQENGAMFSNKEKSSARIPNSSSPMYTDDSYGTIKVLGEFLYWQITKEGLEYGTLAKSDVGFFNIWNHPDYLGTWHESTLLPEFQWNPGFRVSLGYEFEQFDHWETRAVWTQINGKATGSASCDGNTAQIFPEWLTQVVNPFSGSSLPIWTGNYVVNAKEDWWQQVKIADLELARRILFQSYLHIEVFGGIRAAWMKEQLSFSSTGIDPIFPSTFFPQTPIPVEGKHKYNSLGLHGGGYFNWYFSKNWKFFMKGALGLQYGKQHIHQHMIGNFSDTPDFFTAPRPLNVVLKKSEWLLGFNCEQAVGLAWEYIDKKCRHITLSLGYELQEWFDYYGMMPVNLAPGNFNSIVLSTFQQNIIKPGNLYMQGGTVRLQFDL